MGPYEILEHIGKVTHQLALSISMNMIHNVFHVSLLYKYIYDLVHVLQVEDIELKDGLVYEESLVQILDRRVK